MPLKYHLIQRVNPRDLQQPKKYYAAAITRSRVKLRQLAKEIADISTVSPVDTIAVIESLLQLIPQHLAEGDIVRLGDFGSFSIGIVSKGAESEEQFTESMIEDVKISFRPSQEIKKALSAIEFEKQR